MSTLSIRDLRLPPAQWKAVQKRAKQAGQTPEEYVRFVIERDLLAEQSFGEILGPIREDFRKNGITERDLEEIVREARGARRKPRKVRR